MCQWFAQLTRSGRNLERARVLRGNQKQELEDTNRCFVKQLLCLYPFPHFSHRSSPLTLFPSPFDRVAPSLARLFLALVATGPRWECIKSSAIADESSTFPVSRAFSESRAESIKSGFRATRPLSPTYVESVAPELLGCFNGRLRRFVRLMSMMCSPSPSRAAANAATLLKVLEFMLLRRDTRCVEFMVPSDMECA